MRRQAWIVHARNGGMRIEEQRNAHRARRLRLVAQVIGLHAAHHQERRVRVQQCAEQDAFAADRPDQLGATDDGARHDVAVSGGVLGQAVQVQVDVVLAVVVETGEGIIERGQRAVGMRELRDAGDVGDARDRIGRRLEMHEFRRALGERALDGGVILDGQHRV
jgi:hypothetical protein